MEKRKGFVKWMFNSNDSCSGGNGGSSGRLAMKEQGSYFCCLLRTAITNQVLFEFAETWKSMDLIVVLIAICANSFFFTCIEQLVLFLMALFYIAIFFETVK